MCCPRPTGHAGRMGSGSWPQYSGQPARPQRSVWAVIGTVLAVVLVIGGLVIVGVMVLLAVAMQSMGSNK